MLSSDAGQDIGEAEERLLAQDASKYQAAAEALNETMAMVMAACTPGASVLDICNLGDSTIMEHLEGPLKIKYKAKGLAFPTCLSINSIVCNACPLQSDDTELKEKDIVRIEMACHIDGCVASQVETVFVTGNLFTDSVVGRAADVIFAVQKAAEILSDVVVPGMKIGSFNEIIKEVAACFRCKVLETSGCRALKPYVAKDTSRAIPDDGEFGKERAYMIDIAFASEQGELELSDESETTVYRSTADDDYEVPEETLPIFNEIKQKFPKMPFCVRSLENFTWSGISACTHHGILQPYHILQMKSGIVGQRRFILLLRKAATSSITKAPHQLLKTMVPVETLGGIDKVWAKMSRKKKGKGESQLRTRLSYCGRLAVGEESCGFKPHISDVSWNTTRHWGGASEALACTGSFGTYVYLRSDDIFEEHNIEKGWQQVIIQNTPGRFCKWSPDGNCLAVGVTRDNNLPAVYVYYWDDKANEATGSIVYEGTDGNCLFLNPMAWSHDSRYLLAPSDRTHHLPVLKVEKNKTFIHPVRFSEQKERPDNLCAAFHPRNTLFIAASSTGRLKLYEVDESKARIAKADIWNEDGQEWDDDKVGTRDISFCIKGKDKLACARSDWTVKVWSFNYNGLDTSLSPLFIIDPAAYGNLSVKWNRLVDYLAVGDGRQVISIFSSKDGSKLCGNEHNSDVSARFNQATRMDWRAKQFALVSGGHEGFILFWCLHTDPSEVLVPKQRNVHVENMYYTHKPLQHGSASTALQAFEKCQATIREEFEKTEATLKDVVNESEMKSYQLDQIAVLANSALSSINAGSTSVVELADYFTEIVRLSTKKTL